MTRGGAEDRDKTEVGLDRQLGAGAETAREEAAIKARVKWFDSTRGFGFLVSDDARFITGVALPIDGGYTAR